jgi:hypothetical protein
MRPRKWDRAELLPAAIFSIFRRQGFSVPRMVD